MAKLMPCKCGKSKPKIEITENYRIMSGDKDFQATATCPKCGNEIKRWALLKTWVKGSIYKAWNELN